MPIRLSNTFVTLGAILFFVFFVLTFALSTHGALYNFVTGIDYSIDNLVAPLRHHQDLAQFMLSITYLGNPEIIIAFELCLLAVIFIAHRKRIAALFLASIIVSELLSLFFKNLLARTRPFETVFHISRVGYSFPSGHALLSVAFYGCLGFFAAHLAPRQWQKNIITIISSLIIFVIGFSRIFLGVHWFSDVIGGWTLGGVCLIATTGVFYYIHHHVPGDKIKNLSRQEKIWLIIIGLMIGFFVAFFYVTHLSELRSIV